MDVDTKSSKRGRQSGSAAARGSENRIGGDILRVNRSILEHFADSIAETSGGGSSVTLKELETNKRLFILDTMSILEKYRCMLRRPVINDFHRKVEGGVVESEKYSLYREFVSSASRYVPFELPPPPAQKPVLSGNRPCAHCGNSVFTVDEEYGSMQTCNDCHATSAATCPSACFQEKGTAVQLARTSSDKRVQMLDCIAQYQGKQVDTVPEEVLRRVRRLCDNYRFTDDRLLCRYRSVTLEQICLVLRELSLVKYMDDSRLIYRNITGNGLEDIGDIETRILADFEFALNVASNASPSRQVKSASVHTVFERLLRRHRKRAGDLEPLPADILLEHR